MCIYRFLYHCIYIDFCSIIWYLDSMYILTFVIIISSIIYIYFCIMHCIYFRILFTRAPIDSRALRSDGTTLVLGLLFLFSIKVSFIQQWTCKADFYHHDSRSQFRYEIHKHSPGLPLNRKNWEKKVINYYLLSN